MVTKDNEFVDTSHLEDSNRIEPKGDHEGGPPNRINDLNYSDWMKFQKSFFRYPSDQTTVTECIYFFTKERYDDRLSKTLLLGFDSVDSTQVKTKREIDHRSIGSCDDAVSELSSYPTDSYDFILVDFRECVDSPSRLSAFLGQFADDFWAELRATLIEGRFAGVFVGLPSSGGAGYPLPWAVAGSCRNHLKLKDEKVGLQTNTGEVVYNLFVQAKDDHRAPTWLSPDDVEVKDDASQIDIPAWTIPKPPARDEDEILHPAKYPETLIEEFIQLFTGEGDAVLDPMVGTGSTVLAAIQNERDGYGIDLEEEFVEIAQNRVEDEYRMTLSGEIKPEAENLIVQGDATELASMSEFDGIQFDYAVTSPPYWSMLNNPGSENQKERREKDLPLKYSERDTDIGNIENYEEFLDTLESVYGQVADRLNEDGHLTVVVKNVKRDHVIYPLAWDLVERLCCESGSYEYLGTTLWCQDDIGLKPFAVGTHWVSNTLHNYCLHFTRS